MVLAELGALDANHFLELRLREVDPSARDVEIGQREPGAKRTLVPGRKRPRNVQRALVVALGGVQKEPGFETLGPAELLLPLPARISATQGRVFDRVRAAEHAAASKSPAIRAAQRVATPLLRSTRVTPIVGKRETVASGRPGPRTPGDRGPGDRGAASSPCGATLPNAALHAGVKP